VIKITDYEKLQTAKFLWALSCFFRQQIKEKKLDANTYYDIKISGLQLAMLRQKARHYFKNVNYKRW